MNRISARVVDAYRVFNVDFCVMYDSDVGLLLRLGMMMMYVCVLFDVYLFVYILCVFVVLYCFFIVCV